MLYEKTIDSTNNLMGYRPKNYRFYLTARLTNGVLHIKGSQSLPFLKISISGNR
jgi:hypothetical protein